MGLIGTVLNAPGTITALGDAAKGVAEVLVPSATKRMELSAQAQSAALEQFGDEFANASTSGFDRLVNGLNRLPRPLLAFGTIGLFVYAMVDPPDFALRMVGLNAVPEPLWWLLGAVVAFYFGARETHYFRNRPVSMPTGMTAPAATTDTNPALDDWRSEQN